MKSPGTAALIKYEGSDYRKQVPVFGSAKNMYENQAFNPGDPNKPVLSDDSQRSQPLSKDYHEMPKMLGVMTYNKEEGAHQASTLK